MVTEFTRVILYLVFVSDYVYEYSKYQRRI